ncbi:MAG: DinB family protein [Chloroflexi bacterium]|nr:DinB family protein [Chloroflexota bacterium]
MTTNENLTPIQRRDQVLERLDQGHKTLHESLEGIDAEDAFLGSRWSVWDVLNHLDTENYVDALEKIAAGEMDMLPPFNSREEKLKEDIAHLDENFQRFRALVAGLTEERMSQPVTPPNPHNSFPGLTLLELVERSSGHEATHARQIVETRKYVEAFSARERAVTFIALDSERPSNLGASAIGLLKHADYVAGTPEALDAVRNFAGGASMALNGQNTEEIVSRLGRETRAGIWSVICTIGSPSELHLELLQAAEKHCDKVVIQQASK